MCTALTMHQETSAISLMFVDKLNNRIHRMLTFYRLYTTFLVWQTHSKHYIPLDQWRMCGTVRLDFP